MIVSLRNYWLKIISVVFGATFVAYLAQTIIDSGTIIYKNLFFKIIIANFSYLISFFLLSKKKYSRLIFFLVSVATIGTVINTICVTASEGYFDYWAMKANGVSNFPELLQDYFKTFILRMLIFVPIDSLGFLIAAISFYFILKLIDKTLSNLPYGEN